MRLLAALLLLTLLARPLFAGAWMREEGTGFFSYSVSAMRDTTLPGAATDFTQTIFVEYGLRPRLTFGANAWQTGDEATVYVFFRHPLSNAKAPRKLAVELAFGAFKGDGQKSEPVQRLGFSVGQGFATGWGPGWMQLDTSYEYRASTATEILKAEATLGVSYRANSKAMVQIIAEQINRDPLLLTLSPSYLRQVTSNTYLVLGADYDLSGGNEVGLRLGTWLEF